MPANRDLVVIGASKGGVAALRTLVGSLGADFPAAVLVVQHLSAEYPSQLAEILAREAKLPVGRAVDGEPIRPGRVYVAPPDHHLLVDDGVVRVSRGPKENRMRPSVDALFRSAAFVYGPRVVGVVLTGHLDDGTAGLYAIKDRGGVAVVQSPLDAEAPSMPQNALLYVEVDHVLPLAEIGPALARLVAEPVYAARGGDSQKIRIEAGVARDDMAQKKGVTIIGDPSPYACPECHGVLFEIVDGRLKRYWCRTGHVSSPLALMAELAEAVEAALWMGLRALEETEAYANELAERASSGGDAGVSARLRERAAQAADHIEQLRTIVLAYEKPTPERGKCRERPRAVRLGSPERVAADDASVEVGFTAFARAPFGAGVSDLVLPARSGYEFAHERARPARGGRSSPSAASSMTARRCSEPASTCTIRSPARRSNCHGFSKS